MNALRIREEHDWDVLTIETQAMMLAAKGKPMKEFIIVLTADEADAVIAGLETVKENHPHKNTPAMRSIVKNWTAVTAKIKREQRGGD